jgi:hypothetical protein
VLIKEFNLKFFYFQIEDGREISYKSITMETWRLLDIGARSGAENMAIDEALLERKAAGRIPTPSDFSSSQTQRYWSGIINLYRKR